MIIYKCVCAIILLFYTRGKEEMSKLRYFLFFSLLFITGCASQPRPLPHGATLNPYSLESIDYEYRQKVNHD